jgi:hypothetical protein
MNSMRHLARQSWSEAIFFMYLEVLTWKNVLEVLVYKYKNVSFA